MPRPTCVVSPQPSLSTKRGTTGLKNIGNTCFINSVLQVLANTTPLKQYFLSSQFKQDLNPDNPLGSGGKLALQFAQLNDILWAGDRLCYTPSDLKRLVAQKASQFNGFAQHDAQEFLSFLLDGLHEDLNRVKIKKYVEEANLDHLPDVEAARITWERYKARNDSFIVDEFQGQYRSQLLCLVCNKVSVTFDPYMYISVPIPKPKCQVSVIVFPWNGEKSPYKVTVSLPKGSGVKVLCEELFNVTDVRRPRSFEILQSKDGKCVVLDNKWKTHSYFHDDKSPIYAFEVETESSAGEEVISVYCIQRVLESRKSCFYCKKAPGEMPAYKRCTVCHVANYCNKECQAGDWPDHKKECKNLTPKVIGQPMIVSLPKSKLTYQRLDEVIESYARYSVNFFRMPPAEHHHAAGDHNLLTDSKKSKEYLFCLNPINENGSGIVNGKISRTLHCTGPIDIANHSFLAVDWKLNKEKLRISDKPLEYVEVEGEDKGNGVLTDSDTGLERCLYEFTKPEVLSKDESWYCPTCKTHREANKQMTLWSLPDTLIIQLKRFSFGGSIYRNKIDDFISFPLTGLDMNRFYAGPKLPQIPLYDLYGVVNHHGSLLGGHYTAYARCLDQYDSSVTEIGWRCMNDSRVTYIDNDSEVMNKDAYLLFYKRRKITPVQFIDKKLLSSITSESQQPSNQIESLLEEKCLKEETTSEKSGSVEMQEFNVDCKDINVDCKDINVDCKDINVDCKDINAVNLVASSKELPTQIKTECGVEGVATYSQSVGSKNVSIDLGFDDSSVELLDYTDIDALD
ncbi:USP19 [Bugula neritina]|uniref:Ubiquitin carboxyl-terminal hydrolase n=1 Tax=Bugula neritina TaxID=10212 RepID=A0A7J7JZ49_BUGNE|nr:USP19 [Bugula neritina]